MINSNNVNFIAFKERLHTLTIVDEHKTELLKSFEQLDKDYIKMDFLHKQNAKDKAMTINLLQSSVEELQSQKKYIASANEQLIDQKKQLENQSEQLAKSLHALQMSYQELEQFAYIASHDLKSPLRNIGGYAQLLKKRYSNQLDSEADTFLDFIANNAQMMNNIITHLLEYSTIDRKRELSLTDFNRLMELIYFNLKDIIEKNEVVFEFDELPKLWLQKSSMIQVLQHIIENAIKYRSDEIPLIKIAAEKLDSGNSWQFSIKDNGQGLDEIYSEKAFQPFQRINMRDLPGNGMGLAICRKIIKLHGGDIWFKQNPINEGGTTFYFTIQELNLEKKIEDK